MRLRQQCQSFFFQLKPSLLYQSIWISKFMLQIFWLGKHNIFCGFITEGVAFLRQKESIIYSYNNLKISIKKILPRETTSILKIKKDKLDVTKEKLYLYHEIIFFLFFTFKKFFCKMFKCSNIFTTTITIITMSDIFYINL